VADVPQWLTLKRHRDLVGRERHPYTRWILLGVLGVFVGLASLNAFGQRPLTTRAEVPAASLKVYSPARLRSGLYYESRFTIEAHEEIEKATIVLDPGWLEGMTLNTLEPGPIGEASRNGRIAMELGHVPAGGRHLFFLQFQVNPTNLGRRSADVDLYDGERLLVHLDRTVTVFP
jgi:hypothetical protein